MRVHIKELQEGCILTEDVVSLTNRPIIPNKTILTEELIELLKAFLIREVKVQKTLVTGLPFVPSEVIEEEKEKAQPNSTTEKTTNLADAFLSATRDYKKEFTQWQSGLSPDLAKVRSILLPLIEQLDTQSGEIFLFHHLSTEKEYLFQHSIAVGLLSAFIGKKLNYSKGDIVQLGLAGCLADCGMAKISPQILNKMGALSSYEFEEIKKHPTYSYKMIQNSPLLRDAAKIAIFQHHERLDGTGYPLGESKKIHPFAKIIAVADTFHAMTSARLYRKKQSPFRVLEKIIEDNFGKFDIAAIKALQSGIMNFSIGSKVKLSDGQTAEIVFIEEKSPTRPLIKLVESQTIIQLEKHRDVFIDEVIKS
ncbi:HD-GYP domain-containing protein [Robertmurraya kyonggiensis]|uniref:HD-GYP domain-containing protein n=1 Tax=Robertmurraya kyonggiensis TaxID=1037680 RepID=A0A4U1D2T7_9BACI|nr:HD-GYP domain-containing protein [Robertmurraya kyonggiensis]TKC16652.1 HD-GYP domain-containing protein [Robertmurraya kyonggiensis]